MTVPSALPFSGARYFLRFALLGSLIFAGILAGNPTISGTVRNAASGLGVAAADLDVYDTLGNRAPVTGALTDADGSYTLTLPGPGDYIVRVDMEITDPLADQYYPGVFLKSEATPIIAPRNNSDISGIDFSLVAGRSISGRVSGGGAGLSSVDLDLYASNGEFLSGYPAVTDSGGYFTIGGLPAGTYYLKADPDPTLDQFYVFRYFNGGVNLATATAIHLGTTAVFGLNWDLPDGGIIRGTIVEAGTSMPLEGIDLDAYTTEGVRVPARGKSSADGSYSLGPLPSGSYRIRADPSLLHGMIRQYHGGGFARASAVPVAVSASLTTTGIDFALSPGGSISGTIRRSVGAAPLAGIDLDVFDLNGIRVESTTKTDTSGVYVLGPLPPGEYILRADPAMQSGLTGIYHGGTGNPASGISIPVVVGSDTGGIDFDLSGGGWITGTIRNASNAPLQGIDLDVYLTTGERLYPSDRSGPDGSYLIGPVPLGSVVLRADPGPTEGHGLRYYPAALAFAGAAPIPISEGLPTEDQDFALPGAGWISGIVRDMLGATIAAIDLDLFAVSTGQRILRGALTADDGTFLVGPLEPGDYYLRADPAMNQAHVRRYHPDAASMADAGVVSVSAGIGISDLSFNLPAGRSLSGRILDPDGLPAAGIDLDVFDSVSGRLLEQTALTGIDGFYQIPPIPHGSFRLLADPPALAVAYVDTYYGDAWSAAAATFLQIDASAKLDGLDIRLLAYGGAVIARAGESSAGYVAAFGGDLVVPFTAPMSVGTVVSMRFESAGAVIATDPEAPFELSLSGLSPGIFHYTPIATDVFGRETIGDEQTAVILASAPQFSSPVLLPLYDTMNRVLLAWPSEVGRTYRVLSSNSITATGWFEEGRFTGDGSLLCYVESDWGLSTRFLRLEMIP